MTQIIFTGVAGFLFLVGFSLFFVWLDERFKKRTRQKSNKKFQYFDKYYLEMETESEKQQEKKRKERREAMGYTAEKSSELPENIEVTRFSGRAAF